MVMTLDQIVEETRHWPPEKIEELVGRLAEDLRSIAPIIRAVCKAGAGLNQEVPEDEASARLRKIFETADTSGR